MPQVGPLEIVVILVVALLVFGPNKLPDLARQLGRGLREVRKLQESLRRDLDEVLADDEEPTRAPTLPPKRPELDRSAESTTPKPNPAPTSEPDRPAEPSS